MKKCIHYCISILISFLLIVSFTLTSCTYSGDGSADNTDASYSVDSKDPYDIDSWRATTASTEGSESVITETTAETESTTEPTAIETTSVTTSETEPVSEIESQSEVELTASMTETDDSAEASADTAEESMSESREVDIASDSFVDVDAEESNDDDSDARNYVLNVNSKKFHYPDCSSVSSIKSENRRDYYGTREEIIEMGYSPCGRCKP